MRISNRFAPPPGAESQWQEFEETVRESGDLFDLTGTEMIVGARAPGRLDVMGGVADYSGSLVLEMPIAHAACVAWQWRKDRQLRIRSLGAAAEGLQGEVEITLDELVDSAGRVRPAEEVRARLNSNPATRWSAYVAGCFHVMLAAHSRLTRGKADERIGERGASILVASSVPPGAGVSSSAAIEVATMHALSEAAGIHPSDLTLAAWCQRAENTIVGAPCGIMDQVTAALGHDGSLIVLRCQPHDLLGNQRVPRGWRLLGLDSRVKHSVGGRHYTLARVGAFMGLKVIQLESGGKLLDNYLCKLSAAQFDDYRDLIPASITGRDYRAEYGLLPDTVTRVEDDETYRPRACAEHPVLENERAKQLFSLMQIAALRSEEHEAAGSTAEREEVEETLAEAGRLMYESHASYSERLDLGSRETDLLVDLVREHGPQRGLFGAKTTGGGAGGTVAVLCSAGHPGVEVALEHVCEAYEREVGVAPLAIVGSSAGAIEFGARQIATA